MFSYLFIILVVLVLMLKLYLNARQKKSIQNSFNQVPTTFSNSISLEEHQKAAKYNLAKLGLAKFEYIFAAVLTLAFTLGGGIELINKLFNNLVNLPLSQGVAVIIVYTLLNSILHLPFSLYSTFNIEQKFGFNKMTVGLFIADLFKGLILGAVIGIPLLYLVLWLMNIMGEYWWIWVWGALVVFNLLIMIIYPTFIAPLFNKFTPLTNESLKQRIDSLLVRCGFQAKGVFVMDGSKRSSHGNAYFTGIGKTKRIVFFDTLIKQLNSDEIEAVLAHELGHFKKKHIVKQMILSFGLTLVMLFVLSLLINCPEFYHALGVSNVANFNGLILFILLIELVTFPLAPLSSYFSRKNEFEADDFAKQQTHKDHLISGLIALYRDNASTLTPDPLYVKFYYSHPPAALRIANLEKSA